MMQLDEAWIASRSYFIWEKEGRPEGRALEHWLRAKAELEAEALSGTAGEKPKKARTSATKKPNGGTRTRKPKAAKAN